MTKEKAISEKKKLPDEETAKQEVIEEVAELDVPLGVKITKEFDKDSWTPKTELGRKVKAGEIKSPDDIFNIGIKILEPEIWDCLIPNLESDLLEIGQSKGKFGGGKRSIWRQTQKKTKEGNKPHFSTMAVIGNKNGYIGIGYGKAKETVPAREKAIRQSKLRLIKITRGCGSWECNCKEPHSLPFKVEGRCGSSRITLISAPKGAGLSVPVSCKRIFELAGIKDAYSKVVGQTKTRFNLITACFEALQNLSKTKINPNYISKSGLVDGAI